MAFGTMIAACVFVNGPNGFNPCFSGMAFGTFLQDGGAHTVLKFQSLFFWNGLWDADEHRGRDSRHRFQSLFFWNGLWDALPDNFETYTLMFQSLFFWNGLWDIRRVYVFRTES